MLKTFPKELTDGFGGFSTPFLEKSTIGQVIYTTAGGALANLLHKMTDDEAGFFQSEAFSEASRRIFHVCKPNPFFVFPRFFWIDLLFQFSQIFQYVRAKSNTFRPVMWG